MCGICGIVNFKNEQVESSSVKMMMQKMKYRGPNDEGVYIDNNVGLGFVRLSILDLSPLGHQPMFSSDGRYVLIFNGEIYNYIELREELMAKGYKFKSNADSEVLLYSYVEWGAGCLDKFNGMWGFVIFDLENKELFCARDRYGVKPFYYYVDEEKFVFASEIPPILSVLKSRPEPNNQAIFDYLIFNRTDQTEQTFFKGIKKLQHGHVLRLRNSEIKIQKWYDLKEKVGNTRGFQSGEEFKEIFTSAVGLRLRSDVPVGVCLSGGLDSSSITSVLLHCYDKKDLNTFSAVYGKGKRGDESEFIDEFRSQMNNMYFTTPNAETLLNDADKFVRAHGEPIPSTSPYAQFKVMELAKKNVVVTLDGQGADEELAGYHYFFGLYFKELFKKLSWFKLLDESTNYLKNHNSIYAIQTFAYFLLPGFLKTSLRVNEKGYLNQEFVDNYSKNNTITGGLYNSASLNEALMDHFEYKLEHLLKWEDRNSMWFSLESRVPFLDYRLVEQTLASAPDMKIKKGTTKYILREAMRNTLTEKLRTRKDKIGFMTPEDEWFRDIKFQKFIGDILDSESFKERKIIMPDKAKALYQKHLNGQVQISKEIWKWINLELWFREFIDQ